MTEKFNKPIGWLVDEGLMLVDPNDKYAIPLYRHPAPRTPTKKMAKDRIEKLEAALRMVIDWDNTLDWEDGPTWGSVMEIARKALEGKND